jgi:predicted transcriptional regulator
MVYKGACAIYYNWVIRKDLMINGYARASNEILPAVRALIAKELSKRYEMKEKEIANYLDVAQAAVSKYLNDNYSDKIKEIEAKIDKNAIQAYIAKIAQGKKEFTNVCICTVCHKENFFNCKFSKIQNAAQV